MSVTSCYVMLFIYSWGCCWTLTPITYSELHKIQNLLKPLENSCTNSMIKTLSCVLVSGRIWYMTVIIRLVLQTVHVIIINYIYIYQCLTHFPVEVWIALQTILYTSVICEENTCYVYSRRTSISRKLFCLKLFYQLYL